jgi:hypothetical protein
MRTDTAVYSILGIAAMFSVAASLTVAYFAVECAYRAERVTFNNVATSIGTATTSISDDAEELVIEPEPVLSVPEGHNPVVFRLNLEGVAAGFATLPHSRVDVINTVRRGPSQDSYSIFLLENVLVLAVDNRPKRDGSNRMLPGADVTLALTPEQCWRLAEADNGVLTIALRKTNDSPK